MISKSAYRPGPLTVAALIALSGGVAAQVSSLYPSRAFSGPPTALNLGFVFFDLDGDGRDDLIGNDFSGQVVWSRAVATGFAAPQALGPVTGHPFAIRDADGDNDLDIYTWTTSSPRFRVWRNDGGGSYTPLNAVDIATDLAFSVGVAALDSDPYPELVATSYQFATATAALHVFRGLPSGGLAPATTIASIGNDLGVLTKLVDVDGINGIDVLVALHFANPLAFLNDGAGNLATAVSIPGPFGATAIFDANADGIPDLLVDPDASGPQPISLSLGAFPAPFSAPIPLPTSGVDSIPLVLDANGDPYPDVLYGTAAGVAPVGAHFFFGSATGQFTSSALLPPLGSLVHFDDLDGDGAREIVTNAGGWHLMPGTVGSLAPYERVLDSVATGSELDSADVDADGRPDLVFARVGAAGSLRVVLGAGGGTFAELAPGAATNVLDFTLADANSDGLADVVATANPSWSLQSFAGLGDGTFAAPLASPVLGAQGGYLEVADYDGDGRVDVCVGIPSFGSLPALGIARGAGDGTFQPLTPLIGSLKAMRPGPATDLNADGFLDPHASASSGSGAPAVQWWLSNGVGGYASVQWLPGGQVSPPHVPTGDYDGDGFVDLALARTASSIEIRYGNGTGSFTNATTLVLPVEGPPLCAADLDLDGRDELVCGSDSSWGFPNDLQIVFGGVAGGQHVIERFHAPSENDAEAIDADGDGRLELVTDKATLIRNLLPDLAGATSFGLGTPGCSGAQPLTASRVPNVGASDFRILCHAAPPQAFGLGLIGVGSDAGSDPLGIGLVLHVNLGAPIVAFYAKSSASGSASRALPIPNDALLAGMTLHAQLAWPWPMAASCDPSPLGFSSTSGLSITIQP